MKAQNAQSVAMFAEKPARSVDRTTIRLEGYEFEMYLGLHDFEKKAMQRVKLSISVELLGAHSFWDYDPLVAFIERNLVGASIETQEELCERVIAFVEKDPNVAAISVRSAKPDIFSKAEYVGLERHVVCAGGA